jgi:multisubunit Na+/H+ antiporter MnhB subunit
MVALASHALLDRLILTAPADSDGRRWSSEAHPLFLSMLMRPLLPLTLTVSVYILLRGHNLPGGGFVAGLITSVALVVQYLANGILFAQPRLPRHSAGLLALGLLLAAGVGMASWPFGRPFPDHRARPCLAAADRRVRTGFGNDLRSRGIRGGGHRRGLTVLSGLGRLSLRAPTTGDELMEALLAIAIGVLTACGVFLILRARTFPVLLGLTLLSYAVNLFLFASGRLRSTHRR